MRYKAGLFSLLLVSFVVIFEAHEEALGTVIDDFDVPNPLPVLEVDNDAGSATPLTDQTSITGASSSILGTERETEITATGGVENSTVDVFQPAPPGNGIASITNGADANSTTVFTYDGAGSPGGGFADTDLTVDGATAFEIDVLALDYGPPGQTATFQLDVYDGTAQGQETVSVTSTSAPFSTVAYFYFSDFLDQGGSGWTAASFQSVNKIVLTITGTTAFDLDIDNFETNPEPSTFALLGLVCVGLCIYRRRRRKAAAVSSSDEADADLNDAPSHE